MISSRITNIKKDFGDRDIEYLVARKDMVSLLYFSLFSNYVILEQHAEENAYIGYLDQKT